MSEINLSIIIPHYNNADRAIRMFQSIPQKGDIEILFVDDYSAEDQYTKVVEYIKEYRPEIRVFRNESVDHNAGMAKNIGLRNAVGAWVMFAGADDFFMEGFYEEVSRYFHTEYDAVYFTYTICNESDLVPHVDNSAYNDAIFRYMKVLSHENETCIRMSYADCSKMYRKNMIEQNGVECEEIRHSNDVMYNTKAGYYAKQVAVSHKSVYCYCRYPGTLSTEHDEKSFDIRKCAAIRRYAFLYQHYSKADLKAAGAGLQGLRLVLNPLLKGYGIKLSIKYFRLLKAENLPLIIV